MQAIQSWISKTLVIEYGASDHVCQGLLSMWCTICCMHAGFAAQGFWSLQSSERAVTQTSLFDSKVVVCSVLHPIFALLSGLNIFSHNWSLSFSPRTEDDKPCTLDINMDACSSMYFCQTYPFSQAIVSAFYVL